MAIFLITKLSSLCNLFPWSFILFNLWFVFHNERFSCKCIQVFINKCISQQSVQRKALSKNTLRANVEIQTRRKNCSGSGTIDRKGLSTSPDRRMNGTLKGTKAGAPERNVATKPDERAEGSKPYQSGRQPREKRQIMQNLENDS
jgi:hypothetical protein